MPNAATTIRNQVAGLGLVVTLLAPVGAGALDKPNEDVLLTVTGAIAETNTDSAAQFDLPMLDSIGTVTFETGTVWSEGIQTFSGVELIDLLRVLGVESGTLKATAANDYSVEIPVSDAVDGGPIIATRRNGATMSLRDKGPLWIVYPYDSSPDYQREEIYSRSIWQLNRIEVLPD